MKNSFVLYTDYFEHFSLLTLEQQGILINAIFKYQLGEELPEMDIGLKMAFSFIKAQLDRDNEKYEEICRKRSQAGKQGGRPKANENNEKQTKTNKANAFSDNQMKANQADTDDDTVNENGNETVTVYENATDTDILTYQKVLAIAKEECPTVYDRFMNKYPMGSSVVFEKVTRMLDELSNSYSYEKLRELFKKANRMYIVKPTYSKLDFVWVLNNLREIEQATIEEQPNRVDSGLPTCTAHQVNGVWKI